MNQKKSRLTLENIESASSNQCVTLILGRTVGKTVSAKILSEMIEYKRAEKELGSDLISISKKYKKATKRLDILSLIERCPDELGFVIQAKSYDEYVSTYTEIGSPLSEVVYTKKEFNALRKYFRV